MAIQERPVCFDCEQQIERLDEVVFAAPFEEDSFRQVSACFHGICLMRWRERMVEIREQLRQAHAAFMRHLSGDCGCGCE